MRIILKSGTTEHVLCHGPVPGVGKHMGPLSGMRINGAVRSQDAEILRAVNAVPYNRGNKTVRVSFSVLREFAISPDAEKFCWTYQRDVLRSGSLKLMSETAVRRGLILTLANTVLDDVQTEFIGLSVMINYTLHGGALT